MNLLREHGHRCASWMVFLLLLTFLTGCKPLGGESGGSSSSGAAMGTASSSTNAADRLASRTTLRVNDLVIVNFRDLPPQYTIPECKERIRDDGTLVLPHRVSVEAAGKTVTQLQDAIQEAYLKLYNHITVSVTTEERVYYVGGEVKNSGRFPYLGEITVLRAIDSAGGFTDFARRNAIELRRASGESHTVDWKRAKKNPKLDLQVYPNDQIIVPQRLY